MRSPSLRSAARSGRPGHDAVELARGWIDGLFPSRRAALGVISLLATLTAGALLPRLYAALGWPAGPGTGGSASPLPVTLAAVVVVAALAFATLRLQSRCRRLEAARDSDNHAALHDPMTGVANRRHFEERLGRLVADAAPAHALLMIDLDRFKPVNDLYGHAAGDALLRDIATGLGRLVRPNDLVARLGGDEFAVLLKGTTRDGAARTALAVLDFVTRYRLDWEGQRVSVGTSIGLVAIDRRGLSPDELFAAADEALYAAKEAGRGAVFAIETGAERGAEPTLRRVDKGRPEPQPSACSHVPEDGSHQELHGALMACLRPTDADRTLRQGSRRRHEIEHWIAVEPLSAGDAGAAGLSMRELLEDAAARADGGADLVRWMLAMTLDAVSRPAPDSLGHVGFALPVPARAVVTVPGLADELLHANALARRPLQHLTLVLHGIGPVHDDPALVRFHHRMRESGIRLGFEIRAGTLDVLAPLRHVPYDELHLGRELVHGLRGGGSAYAALETLLTVAERSAATLVASGVDSLETVRHLGLLGIDRFGGPVIARPERLHDVLAALGAPDRRPGPAAR